MATITLKLTKDEAHLLAEALDSHIYWQLSDHKYRDNGYVHEPGSDDDEAVEKIEEANAMLGKLASLGFVPA